MNFKKRIVFIAMAITIISLFIGCGYNKEQFNSNKVYNDNSEISSEYDTFGLGESNETIESGRYKGKLILSGSATIWTYESSSDIDLKVPYSLSVNRGKAKIVLISPDNTVVDLIESTDKSAVEGATSITIPIKKGNNRIKVVGYKKADIDIELHIKEGTFSKISFKDIQTD